MKKYYLPIVIILLLALFLSGCSEKSETAVAEPIVIKFASNEVPESPDVTKYIEPWLDEIEERCGGKIVIERYWAETLVALPDTYQSVEDGVVDMAMFLPAIISGKFPMDEVQNLTPLDTNVWRPTLVYWDLYNKFPEMQDEYSSVKLIGFTSDLPCYIGTNIPIYTLEDNAGIKMAATGEIVAKWGTDLGWTMVTVPPLEMYSGLERGIIDGMPALTKNLVAMKFGEVMKYLVRVPAGRVYQTYVMNLDVYNSLPSDVQDVFDEMGGEYLANLADESRRVTEAELQSQLVDMGMEFIDVPADEMARWDAILDGTAAQFAEDMNAAGYPGDELLAEFYSLCEKYAADEYSLE